MENRLLYREKNEVAGMGEKLVRILALGGKKCRQRKQNARATERKCSTFHAQWKSEKRPNFEKWSSKKKCGFSAQLSLRESCLMVV